MLALHALHVVGARVEIPNEQRDLFLRPSLILDLCNLLPHGRVH